jgi:hypothetical protein
MVVLNEFTIDPPYDTVQPSKSTTDSSGIERVIKVVRKSFYIQFLNFFNSPPRVIFFVQLEGERKKLKLTT